MTKHGDLGSPFSLYALVTFEMAVDLRAILATQAASVVSDKGGERCVQWRVTESEKLEWEH